MRRRADVIFEGQIICCQNCSHANGTPHRGKIKVLDLPMCDLALTKSQMQGAAWRRDVIHISGRTRHMQFCGVMGERFCNAHALTSKTETGRPAASAK